METKKHMIRPDQPNRIEMITERIRGESRLSSADKRTFAVNLGKLAARINSTKPLLGARKIVQQSEQEGTWEKRKRFFRLPGEDAPEFGKEGEYASSPSAFISLAEAAGKLLTNNTREEEFDKNRRDALRALYMGSSYMPTYEPSDNADINAKSLMDDYGQQLSAAIEERTRITDLWQLLETTNIDVETFMTEEAVGREPSKYGKAATLPINLINAEYLDEEWQAELKPSDENSWVDDYWSFPSINIGYLATTHKIRIFCIPEGDRKFLSKNFDPQTTAKLVALGFDPRSDEFPEYELNEEEQGAGWTEVTASIISQVTLRLQKNDHGGVKIALQVYGVPGDHSDDTYLICDGNLGRENYILKEMEEKLLRSNFKLSQTSAPGILAEPELLDDDNDYNGEFFHCEIVHENFIDPSESFSPPPMAILPRNWVWHNSHEIWFDEEDFTAFDENRNLAGWTDSFFHAQMLLGGNGIRFYPNNADVEAGGGVLKANTVGAYLFNDLKANGDGENISNSLIKKSAAIAEAGLKFYEAMLEDDRAALKNI